MFIYVFGDPAFTYLMLYDGRMDKRGFEQKIQQKKQNLFPEMADQKSTCIPSYQFSSFFFLSEQIQTCSQSPVVY